MRGLGNKLVMLIGFVGLALSPLNANAQANAGTGSRQTGCDIERNTAARGEGSCDDFALNNSLAMLASVSAQPLFGDDQSTAAPMKLATGYRLTKKFAVPGEGGWDYIAVDGNARRVYVSHGDQIQVLNADSGKVLGQIPAPGAHGVALAPELHRGFTSNGKDKSVTIFDSGTLAVIKTVKLEGGTDAIVYDPATKRLFPMSEKITVIDAQTGEVAGTVDLGGDPEAAAADGKGTVYVNLADKKAVAVVDSQALKVTKTYPIENCTSPHSLSYDGKNERLFVGCREGFVALDATTGKAVHTSLMCTGVDASGFDPESQLVFESCAEGVISVIRQMTPDNYRIIETIPTQLWAKTMAFDPKTKNIYLPTADFEFIPDADPKKPPQRRWKAGSFSVLVVSRH